MPEINNDVMEAFRTYATEHDPALLEPPKADAIVHYRVGDVLVNEPPILPHSIAKALASFSPQPKSIEVLNGGFHYAAHRDLAQEESFALSSMRILKVLSDEIFKVLPHATVMMPSATSVRQFTVDQDFAKLINAKYMVRLAV